MSPAPRASREPSLQVLGEINVDLVARVERPPQPGEMVVDGQLTRVPGGKGANQAAVAARLGARVLMIGAVGRDATGMEMRRALERDGVSTAAVQDTSEATGTAFIIVDSAGDSTLVVSRGANEAIEAGRLSVDPHAALLAHLDVGAFVVERAAARTDGLVVLDCSTPADISSALLDRADVIVTRTSCLEHLPMGDRGTLVAGIVDGGGAVLRRGENEIARVDARVFDGPNPVGARDAFSAALTIGFLRGWSEDEVLHAACAVAAAAVADRGSRPQLDGLDAYRSGVAAIADGGR
ncbi:ribokinase [Microbacterium aoyamense]|uniref:Ribokinase n=1 Tax=Microbacterium aoyamense TaxID=344166 RepID=A0ABN2PJX3_9MICO|nr:PfkB family carbohydrate kinase [Microbacterium aoyamense]